MINNDEFEFVNKPSFVTLISCSSTKPIYFVKIKKKGISKECLVTFKGMLYLMVLCFYRKIPTKGQINKNKQKAVQNYRKRCVCNPRQNIWSFCGNCWRSNNELWWIRFERSKICGRQPLKNLMDYGLL